jgi:photosystem II stability/assembly factor-like uncharacterized protein
VLLWACAACSAETGVLLHISADSGLSVQSLSVHVTADWLDGGADRSLPPSGGPPTLPGDFFIRLPERQSHVAITLSGTDAVGTALGASAEVDVSPRHRVAVSITLMTSGAAPPDLGAGTGTWAPETSGYGGPLFTVWGSGPNDVYAAGDVILHSAGDGVWTSTSLPPMAGTLAALWGSSAANVWAVGADGTLLHRANGGNWTVQTNSAVTTRSLTAIWGSGPTDIYSVGAVGTVIHFDGTAWTAQNVPGYVSGNDMHWPFAADFSAVSGTRPNNVFAASSGFVQVNGLFHNTGGTTWDTIVLPTESYSSLWFDPVSGEGFSATSDPNYTFLSHNSGSSPSDWVPQTVAAAPGKVDAVWGSGPKDVYAVGDSGAIWHLDTTGKWTAQDSGTTNRLRAIWGSSAADVYAVGAGGTILRRR